MDLGQKKAPGRSYVREIIVMYIKNKKNNIKKFVNIGDCIFLFTNKPIYINAYAIE